MYRVILFVFVILLSITSCSKSDNGITDEPIVTPPSEEITTITAKINNNTRASAIVSSDNLMAYWSESDKLLVTNLTQQSTFTLANGAGSANGRFNGSIQAGGQPLYALYPTTAATIGSGCINITIPQTQSYSAQKGNNLKDKVVLFGSSSENDNTNVALSVVVSAVRFDITLPKEREIRSVTMTSEQKGFVGASTLDITSATMLSAESKSLTLTYASPAKGTSIDGWVATATVDLTTEEKVLYDIETDKESYTFCHIPKAKFEAGKAYTVNLSVDDYAQIEKREDLKDGQFYSSAGMPEPEPEPGSVAKGIITYNDGTPAAGVSVSDGFTVVQTASDGSYSLKPHKDTWYIYYSLPADCMAMVNSKGHPQFYTKYEPERFVYNFTLTKNAGGKESKFALFCLADPQCSSEASRKRFQTESVPHIKALAESKGIPCYGVTLGDIVSSGDSKDTNPHLPYMRDHMSKSKTGIPIYQTMGNHDYLYFNPSQPIEADETSSTYNIKAQRLFEDIFGPINHSWNRSDAHIVCMRDMLWNSNSKGGDYSLGFSDEQYEWLKQDLSFVPKDKLVILCVHIPLVNSTKKNVQKVIALLAQYQEAHIMAGHTHYTRNEPTLSSGVYEHVHGAVCGAWWHSNTNGDGTPNGYGVYDIEGNKIVNWYYQGVNTGMNDRDYQIRLYRGNHKSGGKYEYFAQQHGDGVLLANIFNADDSWTIKVYEDGVYSGIMSKIPYKKEEPTKGTGIDNPTKPSVKSSQDWWAIGYLVGVKNRSRSSYFTSCFHLYKYTLKNKNAAVRVEATDHFGRTYSSSTIIGDYDYTLNK